MRRDPSPVPYPPHCCSTWETRKSVRDVLSFRTLHTTSPKTRAVRSRYRILIPSGMVRPASGLTGAFLLSTPVHLPTSTPTARYLRRLRTKYPAAQRSQSKYIRMRYEWGIMMGLPCLTRRALWPLVRAHHLLLLDGVRCKELQQANEHNTIEVTPHTHQHHKHTPLPLHKEAHTPRATPIPLNTRRQRRTTQPFRLHRPRS
ncbi:hypothetical protein B0I35DRAFT_255699 [Stachybotrys elegans]|uniref:Uncharacterized protein n=1 Tax=Stachybotrys elegans TaxID=80388 RepID=A0A8K0SPM1_9HYPO|nr:hypothetical protein B0I35DRAFT_255699 [Stachybotrys elegans]